MQNDQTVIAFQLLGVALVDLARKQQKQKCIIFFKKDKKIMNLKQ